jgi:predicted O-linked N-acetylglucosamine transferase (SPINDLY family)
MGNALKAQGRLDAAIAAYQSALAIKPDFAEAHNNMGNALKAQRKLDEAIAAYQSALVIKPDFAVAEAVMLHKMREICDWRDVDHFATACSRLGILTDAVPPFSMLAMEDNAEQQMLRSQTWAKEQYKQAPLSLPAKPSIRPERLRIGYFSADFHNFPGMYLMAGLLQQHDRDQFEIFAFSYGKDTDDLMRQRIVRSVDEFIDIRNMPDADIVRLAKDKQVDIAIHRNGYTQDSRTEFFAYRIAPIQINYLGYPGTLGAGFIDYIIADPMVIPADQRAFYTEKVIYLPNSYQPNDNTREIAQTKTKRTDFGLPESGFVFCCFNNNYKLSPDEFDIWMRLLNQVEGSVLWLLKSNKWTEPNLRHEAGLRGVDPSRLVFADRLPHSEHLARHKHADLFVDTFNYNAHTTASDALWTGLPVVTKVGQQFAARVSASLLTAVGLPELITTTEAEYEALLLDLATNRSKLSEIRAKLQTNRLTHPLFDTSGYTRDFERGLQEAYERYFGGQAPADIWIQ